MYFILWEIWNSLTGRCWHSWVYGQIYMSFKPTNPNIGNNSLERHLKSIKVPFKHRHCEVCGKSQVWTQKPVMTGYYNYDPNKWVES